MPMLIGPSPGPRRTIDIATKVDILRPAEEVWTLLVDWENLGRWMQEMSDITVLSEHREGVGVEAEATVRMAGITTRDVVRVTRWEPPWILELAHLGWVKGWGYMELSPSEVGVHLFWREQLRPPWGVVGRLGMRVLAPTMRRTFREDLERLRELAEGV